MNAQADHLRRDSKKDPDQLEREIEDTRAHLERTLDVLQSKLSPGEILDEVVGVVRRNGGDFARNLSTQVQNNPLPLLLTGIGLVWLMAASDEAPKRRPISTEPGLAQRARSSFSSVTERAQQARSRMRGGTESAGESLHGAGDSIREAGHRAQDVVQTSRVRLNDLVDRQPLLVGGLGLALGAALGAAAPRTATKDAMLETR